MLAQDSMRISMAGVELDDHHTLLSQIEAELYRSEIYRRAVERLEAGVSEGTSAQVCLKSVAREAIRLALREMKLQEASTPKPEPKKVESPRKKVTADISESHRQECLARLGAQIRAAREARSMSIAELHSKTLVPVHQLTAIETGQGTHLPEDVYLRGFIQRIAKALNVESTVLLDLLPAVDPVKAVLPSWYQPKQQKSISLGGMALSPVHLYLGYAAVLSGGMVWLSQHSSQPARPGAELNAPQVTPAQSDSQPTAKMSANMQVAAPERL
ncbi:helix-turn-helix domain-containing protein [Leptolyngbya sp. GGD]|uniref:helix-turn-helix domain-containing protein n=1 Tax=Leptolyngbya sp. GGD TaxID=2997907 RepID=UPI00227D0245|nr:helix-turn-helix domain-containing protein [Leptolyngbya sp. GGD]MCY6493089.1 helix-turn-helix domain-containing protein [Leptolyngbya sp. GGD]